MTFRPSTGWLGVLAVFCQHSHMLSFPPPPPPFPVHCSPWLRLVHSTLPDCSADFSQVSTSPGSRERDASSLHSTPYVVHTACRAVPHTLSGLPSTHSLHVCVLAAHLCLFFLGCLFWCTHDVEVGLSPFSLSLSLTPLHSLLPTVLQCRWSSSG